MKELVRKCCCDWREGKCRLSSALEGWGCKLLTCLPDEMPKSDRDKARLFANVYQYAEKVGVLECPYYDEHTIDRTLDDPKQLSAMIHLECPTQTELLSDFITRV